MKSELSGSVERVVGKGCAFAAVKEDGSVVTWESQYHGRNSNEVKSGLQGGVEHVVGNCFAFAALKEDGFVVTRGLAELGGDSDAVRCEL